MKLKYKKIGICIFSIVLCLLIIIFSKDHNLKINADEGQNEINFVKKGTFKEMSDSWIYYFDILDYEDKSENYYVFDGYNVKYTFLEDYSIKTIDAETKEVIYKTTSETPILSRSDSFGNEIVEINEFFNRKQFNSVITSSDLNELSTTYISKDLLVEMFNNAISSSTLDKPGKYMEYSHLGKVIIDSISDEKKGKWELTYINDYGYLKYVTIDLKYEDGTYLSDNEEYSVLLDQLEKQIEDSQSFKNISLRGFSMEMSTDLNSLLLEANNKVSS